MVESNDAPHLRDAITRLSARLSASDLVASAALYGSYALALAQRLDLARADLHSVLDFRIHPSAAPDELLATAARVLDRAVHLVDSMEDT